MPVVVCVAGLALSVVASQQVARFERVQLEFAADTVSRDVAGEIREWADAHILALGLMANRLRRDPAVSRSEWEADARLLAAQEVVQAIEWVDTDFRVRWVVPLEGNEQAEGLDLGFEDRRREALIKARDRREVRFSRMVDLVQGGKGFLSYVPIYRGDEFGGFVLGVYRIEPLLNGILANVSPEHGISVRAQGEQGWSRHRYPTDDATDGVAHGRVELPGVDWQVDVWSPRLVRARYLSAAPATVLVVGVLLTVLVAVAVQQTLSAGRRSRLLTREMGERIRAQADLVAAHEELEDRVRARTSELAGANHRLRTEIVERQRAEQQARERQDELAHVLRRVTMGEMANGLAHELTQPLSAIANYAQACSIQLASGRDDRAMLTSGLEEIATHAKRAGEVIHHLRMLLRKREIRRSEVPVGDIIDQVVGLIAQQAATEGVAIRVDVEDERPLVEVDSIQIEQVLLNLIRNSFAAMSQAGTTTPEVNVRVRAREDGRVDIEVSDNGPGLTDQSKLRIFEPFFTTREGGLGMGLSISRSIVESHGGRLRFVPDTRRGAVFRFDLLRAGAVSR